MQIKMFKAIIFLITILSTDIVCAQSEKPFVLGVIDEVYSKELNEKRILNIYLPKGYSKDDSIKYPVIYLLDGSEDEDFIHIVGLVQFNTFEWIKQIPQSIVVGIASVDRRRDFTFPTTIEADKKAYPTTGHSDRFISFLANDLQPYIEKKYNTNNSKTIIGQSLGGLLATEILFKMPRLFNKYIIVSPSLWWNNRSLLKHDLRLWGKGINEETDIYIGVGNEGGTPTAPRVMEMDAKMLATKVREQRNKNVKIYFDYLPREDHATVLHQAVANAFRMLYGPTTKK